MANHYSVHNFTYFGSPISDEAQLDMELVKRIGIISICGRLYVTIRVKCQVYRPIVLTMLCYGAEAWTVYQKQVRKLYTLQTRHLRFIMVIWRDHIINEQNTQKSKHPEHATASYAHKPQMDRSCGSYGSQQQTPKTNYILSIVGRYYKQRTSQT